MTKRKRVVFTVLDQVNGDKVRESRKCGSSAGLEFFAFSVQVEISENIQPGKVRKHLAVLTFSGRTFQGKFKP